MAQAFQLSVIELSLVQTLLRDRRSDWLMKKEEEFLVLFCFISNTCRQFVNGDGMSTGVICWVVLSFTPNNAMVDVLVAKKDAFDSGWWFSF